MATNTRSHLRISAAALSPFAEDCSTPPGPGAVEASSIEILPPPAEADGHLQIAELHAFVRGLLDLLLERPHVGAALPVDEGDPRSAPPKRRPGAIHGGVSSTDDDHVTFQSDTVRPGARPKELKTGLHAGEVFTRAPERARNRPADRHHDAVEVGREILQRCGVDGPPGLEGHSQGTETMQVLVERSLGQAVGRDTVPEQPAELGLGLEEGRAEPRRSG
ncbi:MAG: hypothetical protein M5U22_10535 [Thermoleophilia bacterium]|nr:hypothetical protein [Thermoleophilia bacterium]